MLVLEVEFLLGRYAATDFRDRDRPEWPPHPSRLFSALVAASYAAGLGESARAALLWLEKQAPPQISASDARERIPTTVFVPVNDPDQDDLPTRAEKQPRSFPSVIPQSPVVHFCWPEAQPDAVLTGLLGQIAEGVTYLGSSRSPVRVSLSEQAPKPTWVPDEAGTEMLRVPGHGRLEHLDWQYQKGLWPSAGAFQAYAKVGDRAGQPVEAAAVFAEMVVFRLGGPARMEIGTTLKLTAAMRTAVLALAGAEGVPIPDVLSGHGAHPHTAYVALPFVSEQQRHADGHLLGLGVVLPRQLDPAVRRQALRALARLNHLNVPGVGCLALERVTAQSPAPAVNLRPQTWTGPSTVWTSATPVLLDRFPKKHKHRAEDTIARSCRDVGLLDRVEVCVSRYSPLFGVEPSGRFLKVRREGDPPRLSTHVTLTFDRPVRGPVLLGAGRYFGLGLMRPCRGQGPQEERP